MERLGLLAILFGAYVGFWLYISCFLNGVCL